MDLKPMHTKLNSPIASDGFRSFVLLTAPRTSLFTVKITNPYESTEGFSFICIHFPLFSIILPIHLCA